MLGEGGWVWMLVGGDLCCFRAGEGRQRSFNDRARRLHGSGGGCVFACHLLSEVSCSSCVGNRGMGMLLGEQAGTLQRVCLVTG